MSNNIGISQSDYNDQEILDKSRMDVAPNGAVRFHYTLPSGRELCSEWVAEEKKKGAALIWCQAVRDAIVQDVTEIQRKKIGEGPRKKAIVVPEGTIPEVVGVPETIRGKTNAGVVVVDDIVNQSAEEPDVEVYLSSQLERAKRRVERADGTAEAALEEQRNARTELSKIRKLIAAMAQE